MCFLINHVPGDVNSDAGNAADMKYNSKTDGLKEDTVANPIIYDSEKTFLQEHVTTTCHFESPSVGSAFIYSLSSFCTPNMPSMKWNVDYYRSPPFGWN